jgi:SAM-dependent methyltransferase
VAGSALLNTRLAILALPGANRVYARTAPSLATAELQLLDELALGGSGLVDVRVDAIGGVPYVVCDGDWDDPSVRAVISATSFRYAAYAWDGTLLRPLTVTVTPQWDDDLVTIQRYTGKTNEQFTRLLLNLAVAAGHGSAGFSAGLRVLDPLCGRGTTLNHAVLAGFDAVGIDADRRDVDAYVLFFSGWLKDKRVKHKIRRFGAEARFEFGPPSGRERAQQVVVVTADTANVIAHVGKSSVDALVADLPYGVQHGSRAGGSLQRHPADLVAAAAPAWRAALRPGSGLALAWNVRTLKRVDLAAALRSAGLAVVETTAGFVHKVDRVITRDVIVARRAP